MQEPPPIGPLDREQLEKLLGHGAEEDWLDFKRDVNLNNTGDLVEIAKDVGAMSITGGYIVIGARDDGTPAAEPMARPELFDTSKLGPKLDKYLSGVRATAARHVIDGHEYAMICVRPHPDGFSIFKIEGVYKKPHGEITTAFRKGEVYARHHTQSEPWRQSDVAIIRANLRGQLVNLQRSRHRARYVADQLVQQLAFREGTYLVVALDSTLPGSAPQGEDLLQTAERVEGEASARAFSTAVIGEQDWTRPSYASIASGRAVLTSDRDRDRSGLEWRCELHRDGSGASAVLVGRHEGATEAWSSIFQDRLEVEITNQVDLLLQWAATTGASGTIHAFASVHAATDDNASAEVQMVLTQDQYTSDARPSGRVWEAGGPPPEAAATMPFERANDEPHGPIRLAYELCRDLLNAFGIPEPTLLRDGYVDPTFAIIPWPHRRLRQKAMDRGVLMPGSHVI